MRGDSPIISHSKHCFASHLKYTLAFKSVPVPACVTIRLIINPKMNKDSAKNNPPPPEKKPVDPHDEATSSIINVDVHNKEHYQPLDEDDIEGEELEAEALYGREKDFDDQLE